MSELKQSSSSMIVRNALDNSHHAVQLGMWGALGGAVGSILSEVVHISEDRQITLAMLAISTGFWFSIIGYSIAFSLLLGNSWYLKNELKLQESFKLAVFSGAIPGFIAGTFAQTLYSLMGSSELVRVLCWGIAGGLLGFGLSLRIHNLSSWRGFLGGLIGGITGGITFIIVVFLFGNFIGRMAGIAAISFFIGLTIIIIESAFRDAWLVVHYSHNERKTITIGSQPVLLGSSDKANIYLPNSKGFTSVTARVFVENKMIFIKFDEEYAHKVERLHGQKMGNLTQQLKDGDKRKLGDILFEVRTR